MALSHNTNNECHEFTFHVRVCVRVCDFRKNIDRMIETN